MIHRKCPNCNSSWYSAVTSLWLCQKCGVLLTEEDERPLELKENTR